MTIDRAIEILDPNHREHYDCLDEILDEMNEACRMGMAALKQTRWIPCSERMPKEKGYYLVVVKHWVDGKSVTREAYWNGVDWLSCEKRNEITPRVIHWMLLPEPPEEKTANEAIWHRQPPTAACHVLAFVRFNGYADDFPDQLATLRYTPKDGWLKNGQPIDPEIATVTCWVPMPEAWKDD